MTAEPVAIGLVGCGRLAEVGYVPAAGLTSSVRLAAVADVDEDRRRHVAALSGAVPFASAARLLEAGDVDALVLATPVTVHLAGAQRAAAAGVPVLIEKPPALDAAGAVALTLLDPPPWIGFNRRFDPGVQAAHAGVPRRGELVLRLDLSYRRRTWGAVSVRDDALLDLGPHVVDLARWLTGSPVLAVTGARVARERARFELVLDRARARVRVATDRPHRERVEVRDARGAVVAAHAVGGLAAAVLGRVRPGSPPSPLVASLAGQLAALAAAVRGENDPALGTAADALAVMDVIEAVRESAVRGGLPVGVTVRTPA